LLSIVAKSAEDTDALGRLIGGTAKPGDTIALCGDLGSGKTRLAAAIAEGANIDDPREVRSPTFTLINEYPGPLTIYHCDLYRLGSSREAFEAGVEEIIGGDGLCLIEWADRLPELLPERRIDISIEPDDENSQQRAISVKGAGTTFEEVIKRIGAELTQLIL
jgi:tRNA threonylcarbamoyladenosine biosynthesis protein TsaE